MLKLFVHYLYGFNGLKKYLIHNYGHFILITKIVNQHLVKKRYYVLGSLLFYCRYILSEKVKTFLLGFWGKSMNTFCL